MARMLLGSTTTFTTPGIRGYMDMSDSVGSSGTGVPSDEASTARKSALSWRYGSPVLWSYIVPTGNSLVLDSIDIFGSPVGPHEVRGPGRMRLGTISIDVDGVGFLEQQVDNVDQFQIATAASTPGVGGGPCSSFRANRTVSLGDGCELTSGQVLNIKFSPTTGALGGIAPTVVRTWVFGINTTTGAVVMLEGTLRPASSTASQVVLTYTVPADGFTVRSFTYQADVSKVVLGMEFLLYINGVLVANLGNMYHSQGCSTPGHFVLPFGGLEFGAGTSFELSCRAMLDVGQTFNVLLSGELKTSDVFIMRAFDTDALSYVFWPATFLDSSGSQSGIPVADLEDIVVIKKGTTVS